MTRFAGMLVLLTLLAPAALAAPTPANVEPTDVPALQAATDAIGDAGREAARGAARAAAAAGSALGALAQASGAALAALGQGLAALAGAIASALGALGAALGTLAALVAALLAGGARQVAAHPRESAIVAGSAAGAGAVAWLAKRAWGLLFVPLYTRLAPSEMLDNKVRAAVYGHVKAQPGAHPSAISEALDIGWGTVVYHLARLEESSLVTSRSSGHRKCFFAVGSDLDVQGRSAVAAMSTDKARAIVDALREAPGMSQKDLADRLGMSQALASWHVKRLVASGILRATRAGRSNALHVAEHVPVLAAPKALAA